ncbi:MAG TPA: COQ9 family protein, partial [Alphaproteobacteria bacterium]
MKKNAATKMRDALIEAALPHVPFDGWAWKVLETAADDYGTQPAMARAVFPGGISDVLDGFADLADRRMLARLEKIAAHDLKTRERIRVAVMARFGVLQECREAERLALAYWAVPLRGMKAARIVWRTADRIWDWAGDTATDYNRYTKRGLLSGVLGASTLAWLDDDSPDMGITDA